MDISFEIFDTDNEGTIPRRIAARFDSLVRFCYIDSITTTDGKRIAGEITSDTIGEIKRHKKVNIRVWDAFSECKSAARNGDAKFDRFYNPNREKLDKLDVVGEIALVWLYEVIVPNEERFRDFIEFKVDEVVADITGSIDNIEQLVRAHELYKEFTLEGAKQYFKHVTRQIASNKEFAERVENAARIQREIRAVETTEFEEEKVSVVFQTNVTDMSVYEIFNALVLNNSCPFAVVDKFYKLFKNVQIKREWLEIMYQDKILVKHVTEQDDVDIILELRNGTLYISTEIVSKDKVSFDQTVILLKKLLPSLRLQIVKHTDENISGVFYIPKQTLDVLVFEHLVINNPLFSSFYVDESEKASRTKTSIYTYFETGTELVSFVITPKRMDKYDPTMKGKPSDIFPETSPYLRVRAMKVGSKADVSALISAFSKIITIYKSEYEQVVQFYRRYLPDFARTKDAREDEMSKKVASEKFQKLDPELFSGLYTRRCPHRPVVITEEQIDSLPDKDQIMRYPKTSTEGTQRYYTCQTRKDDYKFIGLRTADPQITKYTYVPCCFKTDQRRGNTPYNKYYGLVDDSTGRIQQRLVTGTKFLDYGKYGKLDEFREVHNILTDPNDDFVFMRWGVDRTNRSFLQCVVEAVKSPMYKSDPKSEANRLRSLNGVIAALASDIPMLNVARQSLFDKTVDEISELILDPETYIDPKIFTQMFERKFNCRIFTFTTSSLSIPRAAKSVLMSSALEDKPAVVILEHLGSTPTLASYPRCELIVRTNKTSTSDVAFSISQTNPVVKFISSIYTKMTNAQFGTEDIAPFYIPAQIRSQIVGQIINSYGKTSALVTVDEFLLYLEQPIAPIPVREINTYQIRSHEVTQRYITDKFNSEDIEVHDIISRDTRTAIQVTIGSFSCYIPTVIEQTDEIGLTDSVKIVVPDQSNQSLLATFTRYQKFGKYLSEFMTFMFSQYLHDKKIVSIDDTVIENFVKEKTVIVPTIEYKLTSRFFSVLQSQLTTSDGKLKIQSEELIKRLVFSLRITISQRTQDIFEYHKSKSIENYMIDVMDFDEYPQQIIVKGRDSVLRYISSSVAFYTITNSITPLSTTPYFFKNQEIGPKTYIAINANSLEVATSIANNWKRTGSMASFPTNTTPVKWDVYVYDSPFEITPVSHENLDIKLVVYLYDEDEKYTVMFAY